MTFWSSSSPLLAFALWLVPSMALAAPPAGYWDQTQGASGAQLRAAIHATIDHHFVIPYDSSGFDTHDAIDLLDEVDGDPARVQLLYSDNVATKASWPDYSREHVWPRSLGTAEGSPAFSDLHHIFACDANVNSARGNKPFGECEGGCEAHPEAPDAPFNDLIFEPPDDQKGDVARAIFYMDVRYEGGGEPDLQMTDAPAVTGCDCIGVMADLLRWHVLDPVDDAERARTDGVYLLQGNRNPFIDHPEWVCELWPNDSCEAVQPPAPPPDAWFNELHYDNVGADTAEGFEIAGPAGLSLEGWVVALYNGNGGGTYGLVPLYGELPDQQGGYGAAWFGMNTLQNGPVDGLALIDDLGAVVEFISYEGALTAVSGPAAGLSATQMDAAESSSTPLGTSLQRVGAAPGAMRWEGGALASPGAPNANQTLGDGSPPPGGQVWINEVHYDNVGADADEGFEIAGLAGTDLSGYEVVLYNGRDGAPYGAVALEGILPLEAGGLGALWFGAPGLQNGGADALALVDPQGEVVEVLSYEGAARCVGGPADGLLPDDIGVEEGANTQVGASLQRLDRADPSPSWAGPSPSSPGALNLEQR